MKKKNLDLKKKLVLNKETIANLTPDQQAKVAGGYQQHTNTFCTNPPPTTDPNVTQQNSDCGCVMTKADCIPGKTSQCNPF